MHRRRVLQGMAAAGVVAAGHRILLADEPPKGPLPGAPKAGQVKIPPGKVPRRKLGKTGVQVSAIGLGGFHLGMPPEDEAIRMVHMALDHGLDFLDNCWDYNEGKSEERMGKALAGGKRKQAFLMTKLDGRTKAAATGQLEQSLKRLQTDVIDLVQVHEVIRMNDAERVFGEDGAIAALALAKQAGKLRFIGFTGHKDPSIHNHMLDAAAKHGFRFDTVQMPLNVMDPHYQSFEVNVLPRLVKEEIGVLGMKPMGSGLILQSGVVKAEECLRYSLGLPTSVVITGCDSTGVLEQALAVAIGFKPLSDVEKKGILERTLALGQTGKIEAFKTSGQFDGTAKNPHWLEEARL